MNVSTLAKFLLLGVWLVCMGWLVRFEAFPHWFEDTLDGYAAMSRRMPAMRDSWMKVLSNGEHVGYVNSTLETEEVDGDVRIVVSTTFQVSVRGVPGAEQLRFTNEVLLDGQYELLESTSAFKLGPHAGMLTLMPADEPDSFQLNARMGDMAISRPLKIPEGAILASPMLDPSLAAMNPGREIRIRTVDPLSLGGRTRTVVLRAEEREFRRIEGSAREVEVTRVAVEMEELTFYAWVDEYGRVLRQETPFGLVFERANPNDAIEVPDGNGLNPMRLLSQFQLNPALPEFP